MKNKPKAKSTLKIKKHKKLMMINKEVIKQATAQTGEWAEKDLTTLLGTPSNTVASIILNRTRAACASKRHSLTTKDGRRSVTVERMGQKKAKQIAYTFLNKLKNESQKGQFDNHGLITVESSPDLTPDLPQITMTTIKNLSPTKKHDKRGRWSEDEENILLQIPSNVAAANILGRTRDSCAGKRFGLINENGRKGVEMKTMGEKRAWLFAKEFCKNFNKEHGVNQNELTTIPHSVNDNIKLEYKSESVSGITPVIIQEQGFILLLNDQEIIMKNCPKKLIIRGSTVMFE